MNRIKYLDCMRGVAMICVVYSHVIYFSYEISLHNFMNSISMLFFMPLFFWISGFWAYTCFDTQKLKSKLKKRLTGQLLPAFVMLALYDIWREHSYISSIEDNMKQGYWFTIVLFILFFLFSCVGFLLDRIKTKISTKAIIFSIIVAGIVLSCKLYPSILQSRMSQILSLPQIEEYAPYYCLGILSKMYYNQYIYIITNTWIVSACLVIFAIVYGLDFTHKLPCCITSITVINAIFYHYKDFFTETTKIGRSLSYIGRNTTSIYFLHYFLFKYLKLNWVATFLIDNNTELLGGIITLLVSLIIVVICLLIEKVLQVCKPLHALMFGLK